jgi:DNA replication protein DnaC
MERTQIFELMSELRLYGMKAAYDEIMATGIKRQHEPPRIVGDLLQTEVSEKQARSIKYQIRIAKLPLAKDLNDFEFEGTPINERLVRDLTQGDFLAEQRNCVLVGGTGTGKTHLAIAIARSCIRAGKHAASTTPSISSTGLRLRRVAAVKDGSPNISPGGTSLYSTNSDISPLPKPAVSCCSI